MTRARSLLVPVAAVLAAVLGAGCPKQSGQNGQNAAAEASPGQREGSAAQAGHGHGDSPTTDPPPVTEVRLPPAPPVPAVPAGLPRPPAHDGVTPEAVALGELLFHDQRLSASGAVACASCHDPTRGYAGGASNAATGKPNLRRVPALVNLAWATELGWDGRYASVHELLPAHVRGQLGAPIEDAVARIAGNPTYRAHLARVGGAPHEAALSALSAFVLTRYEGDAPWDRLEGTARAPEPGAPTDPLVAGYLVFAGKAQCAVCHPPPLYTNHGYHVAAPNVFDDPGRGLVDKTRTGAFRTPTLRGAARRPAFTHTGAASSLEQVVDGYLAASAGAQPGTAFDPAIRQVRLTPEEREHLLVFLRALTSNAPAPTPPTLP